MDEDRYYNLGSHDKLFNQIDELTDALASRDAEIESLRQQVNNQAVDIVLLRRQVSALEKQARSQEIESMRQQLADTNAAVMHESDVAESYREEADNLRQQLVTLKTELRSIGEAIDDPRTDLTMTMSEIILEYKQQLAAKYNHTPKEQK